MTSFSAFCRPRTASLAALSLLILSAAGLQAQKPEPRITGPVSSSVRSALAGSHPARARAENEAGRVDGTYRIQSASITLGRSDAQQAALDALIAAQQDPSSPQYHQWLSPDDFAARFGAADADLAAVQNWLEQQGLKVEGISRNRSTITFSGSAAQVEQAFATEMHYYNLNGVKHFAPSTDLSVPAAMAPAVLAVGNLSDFRPHSHKRPVPAFTSSQTGSHFLQPGDVSTIYDINAAYNAGYNGSGQTIAVIGQSAVISSDITTFQTAAGVPVRVPSMTLMPGTGSSALYTGDESESDLDLEYASAIAKGANIVFVYTGSSPNYGAFDALGYAITNKLAPIISVSYGDCEVDLGTFYASENALIQQAAAQGQTVVSASGDEGSTDCYQDTSLSVAQREAVSVDWPASSQYVTGMGGTEFPTASVAIGNTTYWAAQGTTDVIASAKSYIPEQVWNDDSASIGLSAGGGGISTETPRPTWQTGVPGIPSGSFRLVPDVSLSSSPNNAGYLYCSSDTTDTGINGSCANGFRDATNTNLTVAGGTSFAAPIFAGMIAIINQKIGSTAGQGVINPTLYTLAANATTYASAFHDITSGSNECLAGTTYCATAATTLYSATTGYDLASGLGSVDLYNLMMAWPNASLSLTSKTTVTAATLTPLAGASDLLTFTVSSGTSSSTAIPSGSIAISVDGNYVQTVPLVNGVATYTFSSTVVSAHTISANYSGDATFAASTGSVTVTTQTSTLKSTTLTLAAASSPAQSGTADNITITVTGTAGSAPTGTVNVRVDSGVATAVTLTAGSGASSTAVYVFNSAILGTHTITATYLGDSTNAVSVGTLSLPTAPPGGFTLSAPSLSVADGNSATEAITVTPTGGYSGLVSLTLTTSSIITNACYTVTNPTVSGTATVAGTATIYTNQSSCPNGALALKQTPATKSAATAIPDRPSPSRELPVGISLAGLAAIGFLGRRSRRLRGLIVVALLAVAGFGISGCGSTSSVSASDGVQTTAAKGTYTVTVRGSDAATGFTTATTTFTLTIQ